MWCHVCNVEVGEGQRFCHACGESLAGVTDATQELRVPPGARPRVDDLATTQPIDEVPDRVELPTEAIPATDLPDARAPGSSDDVELPVGKIGASLFDPATAPPAADPGWSEPIPPLRDDMFATTPHGFAQPEPDPVPADESTTALPQHDTVSPIDGTGEQQTPLFDVDAVGAPAGPLLDGDLRPFRFRPTLILGFLGMLAALMMSVADVTDIRTDRVVDGIDNRLRTVADIGTNLPVAGFVGAAIMLIGGLLHCFGLRWGAGLAGGAGLALIGWAGLTLGLAEVPIHSAERITRDPNTPGPFTLTVTRDLGYWLVIAIAAIGLLVFAFSLTSAGTGERRGLNPWTAALGALAALVTAAGPLITVGGANFDVNFGTDGLPVAFFAGRLVQLGLIAAAGVVGFLVVRAYGLGLAAGGVSVALWLWLSSLLEIGDRPLGIAAGNLGSSDTSPHDVTTVGVASTIAMLVLAAAIAIVQHTRSST